MAGRIRAQDIDEVKARVNIADVVSDYVALKPGGVDSMKGLCPFHDERSPSFHVRPALGYYHCFGCGESGDAISFIQNMDHLSFAETVERLAAKVGYTLTYEEGGAPQRSGPNRTRLFAANDAAARFFAEQLASDEAAIGRDLLLSRGFDEASWARFGVGYARNSWESLKQHLGKLGFTEEEMSLAGLLSQGQRGTYDRFRGRLVWPIRDTSGQTLGFGARKLREDDNGPKYLNTPETPIYHKSKVLYGLDLGKRAISQNKRVIVVEGYTDVMACHLAGITEAVATCGTAFGKEHISLLRRVMGDDVSAEVIFTFDPDEAGQKAALKAFADEKQFSAQTYMAVAPDGLDPSDLRQHRGDEALTAMFEAKKPLFEFALRQAIGRFDLNTVEGRSSALRAAAPIVADIRDEGVRKGYARELSLMLGADLADVQQAMRSAHANQQTVIEEPPAWMPPPEETAVERQITLRMLPNTPPVRAERDALMAMLQYPETVGVEMLAQAVAVQFHEPTFGVVAQSIAQQLTSLDQPGWLDRVITGVPENMQSVARELALAPIPQRKAEGIAHYVTAIVSSLIERDLLLLKQEMLSRLQRIEDPQDAMFRQLQEQIRMLEQARRSLRPE
ncbi:DNA primase [Leucobacter chinensis]|uniref:DNA primase n=1 Tax=Leucobacter chinensis TaxID=2851010 RepID=UPI001C2144B2|nr:DNA primase [Leucobacter chinensis]